MAVHNVTPLTNITEFIGSDEVQPGDVLLLADGVYQQMMIVPKDYIRIVANGKNVIFDGNNTLTFGVVFFSIMGVEVRGVKFKNHVSSSILVFGGSKNRVISNCAERSNVGIEVFSSDGNLIYHNTVKNVNTDGIKLYNASTGNFLLENKISGSGGNGINCFLPADADNTFVGNVTRKNAGNGFEILGSTCCIFKNCSIANAGEGFLISDGSDTVALQNEAVGNSMSGIRTLSSNSFISRNQIEQNKGAGVEVNSSFSSIEQNDIQFNLKYGLAAYDDSRYNLFLRNFLVCNEPANIFNRGEGNNFVQNVEEEPAMYK
ncbi:MAG: right-handed parallel beta-helix repeat-containing protein [Hungatella sp.]|nr:right-handed parallel beta-helix repeat-containing protein [Hungatella sp.]